MSIHENIKLENYGNYQVYIIFYICGKIFLAFT